MGFFFFFLSAAAQILVTGCLGAYSDAAFAQSGCEGAGQRALHYPYCPVILIAHVCCKPSAGHVTH